MMVLYSPSGRDLSRPGLDQRRGCSRWLNCLRTETFAIQRLKIATISVRHSEILANKIAWRLYIGSPRPTA